MVLGPDICVEKCVFGKQQTTVRSDIHVVDLTALLRHNLFIQRGGVQDIDGSCTYSVVQRKSPFSV